ncbi:YozE family protein [Lapidilactobacillus luobeiensis]|uniref:YozE family protein n=1 Tax=Lapidilactobacillus luobeiensis TaxID=2950371 RepID=UPI0021C486ED|nr:YozE family protein [Lapidilactobacillus luobeiensis]
MTLRRSFYQYLMTQRDPNSHDEIAQFANNAFYDHSFPKQETDYDTLSRYLELNGNYLPGMTIFDQAYQRYLESEA